MARDRWRSWHAQVGARVCEGRRLARQPTALVDRTPRGWCVRGDGARDTAGWGGVPARAACPHRRESPGMGGRIVPHRAAIERRRRRDYWRRGHGHRRRAGGERLEHCPRRRDANDRAILILRWPWEPRTSSMRQATI